MNTKLSLLFVLVTAISLDAAQSLNEQIEAIKHANPQERVELMNALKMKIAAMNEEERSNALETLKSSMGGSGKFQNGFTQGSGVGGSGVIPLYNKNINSAPKQQGHP
ncbi:MAG: hypothetical protein PHI47_09125 [Sulfuricurvum sp.]|uniref:hypothetical protein n=1 Tax=Sulfuricurvum sp. TaxID=2025608 RepID=UPI0026091EF0|nr:hypothetical protein [Sulfuricurvum sp.]MDD2950023.1 hypothetical protein [Sulfuricurvum sp.]MDD5117952.1 hypothetical protein [Sulfuricurvum sp.]MDD5160198.1 hypothetical protein [Sulfuricurvum sp.]